MTPRESNSAKDGAVKCPGGYFPQVFDPVQSEIDVNDINAGGQEANIANPNMAVKIKVEY